jgi:hypothetical protein
LVRKVADVDDAAARRVFVGSGTSLLWLTKHVARAESIWLDHRFAGGALVVADDSVRPDDTLAAAIETYRAGWDRVDAIIAATPDLGTPCRRTDEAQANLRWVLMHLLEETARHAGHADIIRELIDGQTGR